MNKIAPLLIIFFGFLVNAQSNEIAELRRITKEYDSILIEYQIKAKDSLAGLSNKDRNRIMAQYEMRINEERRNIEFDLLKKIKLNEVEENKNPVVKQSIKCKDAGEHFQMPNFEKKSQYKATKSKEVKSENDLSGEFKSIVTFTVTEDGNVKNVSARGENFEFNRELELIMYKMEKKWTPLCVEGMATSNNFRMPVTLILK
ncbi:hypothetical protein [Chryseobacterium sp. HSC-36S06]|uniref:hypothetical protein n=1 Tax=Chryseobacterium sp. HSC-36S06 TaxID=2910970 RepID=UPI0020A021F1|nr:hypothetical protein [Chryseobacterium sp. HSC-36S06]MCP2037409.1 hypothetical protein [Chryseobacterium sp. HSC-36S06]